ncbi:hypothetical protein NECAME_11444 [Necator americanus]|uniref:Peptidase S1 domain-containing protein n=1 Tax=Necator americanus TaxID=51031 RepID=W2T452_NECAM|nr:hypothetical protein NECAME_11444 [Necator americanus]ETN76780.1 hypothetical protein NECAME_11444 [Necator americanus]
MFFLCTLLLVSLKSIICLRFCDSSPNSSLFRVIGGTVTGTRASPKKTYILTGVNSLSNPNHIHTVERAFVHPDYDADRMFNDIAVVKGDSGGPLLAKDRHGRLVQLGITSFGAAGLQGLVDQSTYPGVYTRVSSYVPWIESVINAGATSVASLFLFTLILEII